MHPRPVLGAKERESMDNIMISAWFAMDRVVYWWLSLPENARTVAAQGY